MKPEDMISHPNLNQDTRRSIAIQLFHIISWTAIIANSVGFISNMVFYGLAADTIFYGICAVVMIVIGLAGRQTGKIRVAETVILVIINVVEFPVMNYLYGAGRIVYMILGIIGIMLFVPKKWRIPWAVLTMIFDAVIIVVSVIFPSTYLMITPESDLGASVMSFVIVVISISLMIRLLVEQYETQNRELIELTGELEAMAHKDPLTHLYNRRYLTDYLEPLMEERESAFSVVLMDLDDFKGVNDNYGHIYGDEVLENFGRCMLDAVKDKGIAARFGGEEFMLVLHTTQVDAIEACIAQIRELFEQFSMESKGIRLTFSGGVEVFKKEDKITQLFNAADEKLYSAKEHGKNQVIY